MLSRPLADLPPPPRGEHVVKAAIYVPQALRDCTRYIETCVTRIGQLGYQNTNLILRDWLAVEHCLRDGIIDVVIDERGEHRPPGWRPGTRIAPVVSLERQRQETVTRRLSRNQPGYHRPTRKDNVGMTTGRVRRIIAGDEPAPDTIDPDTVAAVQSIMTKLEKLKRLEDPW